MTEKMEIVVRVVRLRGRWAGSGQVNDGLLFFFPLFFSSDLFFFFL
jgi:hypothetical protein